MKKQLFIVALGAIVSVGLVRAKGSVVNNSEFSVVKKYSITKNVNISVQYNGFMTCTFLVSVTEPRTGEVTQWRETYTVKTEQECKTKYEARKREISASLE